MFDAYGACHAEQSQSKSQLMLSKYLKISLSGSSAPRTRKYERDRHAQETSRDVRNTAAEREGVRFLARVSRTTAMGRVIKG